jgi:hypothetical protein
MIGLRLFRALLRVLPFDFRADYGAEIEQTFQEQQREASGVAGRARVWAENVAALFSIGPREHMSQLRRDVTALRGMRRNPGFVTVAVVTLSLGTGVNTAIFSIVHAVLLEPLPYGEADALVMVMHRYDGAARLALSDPEYFDYSEQSRSLDIAVMSPGSVTLNGGTGEPQRVGSVTASTNILRPSAGSPHSGDLNQPTRARQRVGDLSDATWRSASAPTRDRRPNAEHSGQPRTVVGVLPPDRASMTIVQACKRQWSCRAVRPARRNQRGGHYLTGTAVCVRAPIENAGAEMDAIVGGLAKQSDQHDQGGFGVSVRPLEMSCSATAGGDLVLGGAVGLVLLLACANVANLMMARRGTAAGAVRARGARCVTVPHRQTAGDRVACAVGDRHGARLAVAHWSLAVVLATGPLRCRAVAGVARSRRAHLFGRSRDRDVRVIRHAPAMQLSRAKAGRR